MQGLPQIVSLVPQTGLQFIDIRFNLNQATGGRMWARSLLQVIRSV
jgi:hypothetical protein